MSCSTTNSSILPIGPTGATGATGATGPQGPSGDSGSGGIVLYNTMSAVSTLNNLMSTLQSYSLIANQLLTNGDYVECVFSLSSSGIAEEKTFQVVVGGTVCHSKVQLFRFQAAKEARLMVRLNRTSSTSMFIDFLYVSTNGKYGQNDYRTFFETGFSVSNLTSNTLEILLRGNNTEAIPSETAQCNQMVVTYFKKS